VCPCGPSSKISQHCVMSLFGSGLRLKSHRLRCETARKACSRVRGYLVLALLREFVDLGGRNLGGKGDLRWGAADLGCRRRNLGCRRRNMWPIKFPIQTLPIRAFCLSSQA